MLLQNVYISFSNNGPITDVQVTHAMGTNTPLYHNRHRLFKNARNAFLNLALKTAKSFSAFPNNTFEDNYLIQVTSCFCLGHRNYLGSLLLL